MTKPLKTGTSTLKQFNTASEAKEWLEAHPDCVVMAPDGIVFTFGIVLISSGQDGDGPFTPLVPLTEVATQEQFESVMSALDEFDHYAADMHLDPESYTYKDYLKHMEAQ